MMVWFFGQAGQVVVREPAFTSCLPDRPLRTTAALENRHTTILAVHHYHWHH